MATDTRFDRDGLLGLLARLDPWASLAPAELPGLLDQLQFAELPAGATLQAANEHCWLTYLLSGQLLLRSNHTAAQLVVAGSPRARQPLFEHTTSDLRAQARAPVRLLRVARAAWTSRRPEADAGEGVDLSEGENQLLAEIQRAYAEDRLRIPSLPDIAMKIRDAVGNPRMGVAEVASLIQSDPALAGRLIQVANSALYRGVSPISSLREAVGRLGLNATRSLAFSLAVKQLFKLKSVLLRKRVQVLYDHSTYVSALAFVLARSYGGALDAEASLLAGLVHDIGAIPILHYADHNRHLNRSGQHLEEAVAALRAQVGAMVLRRWRFDPGLIAVVEQAEDWYRSESGPPSLTDVVIAAQLFYYGQRPNPRALPPLEQVPLYRKLSAAGELDPVSFLAQAGDEIEQLRSLLDGAETAGAA